MNEFLYWLLMQMNPWMGARYDENPNPERPPTPSPETGGPVPTPANGWEQYEGDYIDPTWGYEVQPPTNPNPSRAQLGSQFGGMMDWFRENNYPGHQRTIPPGYPAPGSVNATHPRPAPTVTPEAAPTPTPSYSGTPTPDSLVATLLRNAYRAR